MSTYQEEPIMKEILDLQKKNNHMNGKTGKQKASYCLGLEAGNGLKMQFDDLDSTILLEGFTDAISGKEPKISREEFQTTMQILKEQVEQQQKAYISQMAQTNKKEGESFLSDNKQKEGVITLPSGLQYEYIKKGEGSSPSLTDTVTVHYKGTFIGGDVFDSSYQRQQPQIFPVNRVIPGWSEALQLMHVGDILRLCVPSYLAYGENGFPPHIEPNTVLIFEMELLGINET
jgi:FKBP-type peptidyl-prolyl cis-trans isomerase FklB